MMEVCAHAALQCPHSLGSCEWECVLSWGTNSGAEEECFIERVNITFSGASNRLGPVEAIYQSHQVLVELRHCSRPKKRTIPSLFYIKLELAQKEIISPKLVFLTSTWTLFCLVIHIHIVHLWHDSWLSSVCKTSALCETILSQRHYIELPFLQKKLC